ncbi:hypothetical protein GCWU000325_01035 [Alloprevotella tannerae ATCC 51259]|uniref:Uncharacterized protein n=1 Tax=Alloprevotella tannerae ATCC 51259 TaxID=626522 RepID=C9LFP6_9BACT|nr:hypothetical protein GCWU000325_01035 [Alloprevotella tannerae ATCC 51259]
MFIAYHLFIIAHHSSCARESMQTFLLIVILLGAKLQLPNEK